MKILLTILLAMGAQGQAGASQPIKVQDAKFFSERVRVDGESTLEETRIIPYRMDTCYRWVLNVPAQDRTVVVREVFKLPAPATQWGADTQPGGRTIVAENRASATTNLRESLDDGILTNLWCVADGDPVGKYVIRVYFGDALLHTFRFRVVEETF